MPVRNVTLGLRSNPERRNDSGAGRLINCYAEDAGEDAPFRYPLYACDGFSSFSTLTGSGIGVCRGMLNLDDTTLYVVSGQRINSVDTAGTATDKGALATSGYAYMARNRKTTPQVAIVTSDGLFRIIEGGTVSTPSLDGSIPASLFNSVCAHDGYFIITLSNGEWYITSIDEGTSIDALDFSTAASNPDGLSRALVRARDLVLMGPRSIEYYTNTGAADFPFERVHASTVGLYAPASAVALSAVIDGSTADTIAFAAANNDGAFIGVMILAGYEARKISTPALDRAIRDEPTKSSIRGFQYTRQGITFYCVTGSSFSWEWNAKTGFLHERISSGLDIWRVVDAVTFNDETVYGDYTSGVLYQADHALTPGSASACTVRQSLDNGSTWNTLRAKSIGGSGAELTRLRFNRFGMAREKGRILEIALTNAVIENGTANSMTVYPPPMHAWPARTRMHALFVDATSGASLTSNPKGFARLAMDVDAVKE